MVVEFLILRKRIAWIPQVSPAASDHDGADDALLHTYQAGLGSKCSVELLPSMDRIYGDSEHPMTEIDIEVEQIYARVVAQVGALFRYLILG
jgi:hypothetical protein